MDYIENNRKHWDKYSKERGPWSRPSSKELIEKARQGNVEIFITTTKLVPSNWFPKSFKGLKILGLAAGGGQQIPLLAAAGADVTSFDLSEEQLERDREVCQREGFEIKTIQGDMMDLSAIKSDSFDMIINPVSSCFISDIKKVWKECARVLKAGGILLSGANNPVVYSISEESYEKGELLLSRKIPYSDLDSLSDEEIKKNGAAEFGHSLTSLIGGQLEAGFQLTHFYEDNWGEDFDMIIDRVIPQFFATRAIKAL